MKYIPDVLYANPKLPILSRRQTAAIQNPPTIYELARLHCLEKMEIQALLTATTIKNYVIFASPGGSIRLGCE